MSNPARVCRHCGKEFFAKIGLQCGQCRQAKSPRTPEQRQRWRAAEAAKKGKLYRTTEQLRADRERERNEKKADQYAEWNAVEALRYWINEKGSDEQVRKWFVAIGRPWSNPRLSDAEQYRLRYAGDVDFQISERLRRQMSKKAKRDGIADMMRSALVRNGSSGTVHALLGYTIAELRIRLEAQFTDGMSWPAFMRGEIHIDHRVPQAWFDLSDDSQWRQCWALSNLQPMWGPDNIRKSDKLPCGTSARVARGAPISRVPFEAYPVADRNGPRLSISA